MDLSSHGMSHFFIAGWPSSTGAWLWHRRRSEYPGDPAAGMRRLEIWDAMGDMGQGLKHWMIEIDRNHDMNLDMNLGCPEEGDFSQTAA